MKIQLRNHTFELFPQKAMFWEEKATLIISDLHIGKILHFRKAGIAVSPQAIENNFFRLNDLMQFTRPDRVIFTGDVFHSDPNHEWELFREWRYQFEKTEMHLVLGNHDRLPEYFAQDIDIVLHQNDLKENGFIFTHHPKNNFKPNEYVVCGHVHPVVRLTGRANQQLRIPCFYFGEFQAVLPSFGYFTGGYEINSWENGTVIAVAANKLMMVKDSPYTGRPNR